MSRRSPEKAVEHAADQLMSAFGFTVIRLSQPRRSMVTEGLPDRRYMRADRLAGDTGPLDGNRDLACGRQVNALTVWFEAKSAKGKQSTAQRDFQILVESCGEFYVCGGVEVLEQYLCDVVGLARRVPGGIEGVRKTVRHSA